MKKKIPFLSMLSLLMICIFSSCRQDTASPIRNVRFDPKLLNQMQDGSNAGCTNYTYFYNDQQKVLGNVYTKQLLLAFDDRLTYSGQRELIGKYGFIESLGNPTSTSSNMMYTVELEDGMNCKQVEQAIEVLKGDAGVRYVAPYFLSGNGKGVELLGISNEVIVRLKENAGVQALEQLADAANAIVVKSLGENVYLLQVDKASEGNALELANTLTMHEEVAHAEPDFIVSLPEDSPQAKRSEVIKNKGL